MFRWLLGKIAVKSFLKEDPYFNLQVEEALDLDLVRVTVTLIRSSATWHGKFKVEGRSDFPLEIRVPGEYERDGDFLILAQELTDKNEIAIDFEAAPLRSGAGRVQFWFERNVGLGGQIAVVGTVFGQGDQEAIQKHREFKAKHWKKWLEDNPDWSGTELK